LKGAAPIGKFFVKAKTNNQKGATPMQSKLKPSQQKSVSTGIKFPKITGLIFPV
jgi:formaldehyde-activating enzyme involved in methanogenesis